ncbi:MAG: leucine-rich repeat protein [Clostridia bacterium]|nr:leucine-rich repeat protein [Clostridia bacterium]
MGLLSQAASTTDWVLASAAPGWASITDRKYTYTLREYTSSGSSSLSGWTKYDTKRTSWGGWSDWLSWDPSDGRRDVETRSVYDHTEYHYYRWTNSNHSALYTYKTSSYSCTILEETWFSYELPVSPQKGDPIRYDGSDTWPNRWVRANYAGNYSTDTTFTRDIYRTEWRYRDPVYTYYFYRDLSKESTSNPSGLANVSNIKEWVRYRNDTYQLNVNFTFDDERFDDGVDGCTFDVYINGSLAANDSKDFSGTYTYGSSYEIKDIKTPVGITYTGGSLTGKINDNTEVCLDYKTLTWADQATFGTNIYYLFNTYSPCTWSDAQAYCESQGGHLATVTSQEEMDAIKPLITNNTWLGATEEEQDGTWKWVTGEEFAYTDWNDGQPDNCDTGEDRLMAYSTKANIKWNDVSATYTLSSFIMETSQPMPDAPADVAYWDGHLYELYTTALSWDAAKSFCEESRCGHLLTINSAEEQTFIEKMLLSDVKQSYCIGGTDAETEGKFKWITSEPFTYTNWDSGEPDDLNGQDYLHMYSNGKWGDDFNSLHQTRGFICEIEDPDAPDVIYGISGSEYETNALENNKTFTAIGSRIESDNYSYDYVPEVRKLIVYKTNGYKPIWLDIQTSQVKKVVFSEGVTYIGGITLFALDNVDSIVFPSTLTSVGTKALSNTQWYKNLEPGIVLVNSILYAYKDAPEENNIVLNTGVTSISGNFSESYKESGKSPEGIQISATVTKIDNGALAYAADLKTLTVHSGNPAYKAVGNVLYSKDGTKLVCYPAGISAGSITVPDSVTDIGSYAFAGCESLTEITLGKNVATVGYNAFKDTSLQTIRGYAGSYAEQYAAENGYTFIPYTSTVTFDFNDDQGTTQQRTVNTGTAIGDLYVPGMEGYEFAGWYLETDDEDIEITADYIVDGDITVFAYWDPIPEEEPYISSISVTSLPEQVSYFTGELLSTEGLTITATYSNGKTQLIDRGFACAPALLSAPGTQEITVIYAGLTDTFNVTVVDVVPISLTLTSMPNILTYFVSPETESIGGSFNPKGLVGVVEYNNGTRRLIRDTSVFEYIYDFSEPSDSTNVTVNYQERDTVVSAFYQVRVLEKPNVYSAELNAATGEEIAVPIYISGNTGLMGCGIELTFDPSVLTPESISKGINSGDLTWDKGYGTDNSVKIFWADSDEYTGTGLLFTVYFRVSPNTDKSQTTVDISGLPEDSFNAGYENVQLNCSAATVNITHIAVPTVYSFDTTVEAGKYLDVPVLVRNDVGMEDMTIITMTYDTSRFAYVSLTNVSEDTYRVTNQNGKLKISVKGFSASSDDRTLFKIRFNVLDNAQGNTSIRLETDDDRWKCEDIRIKISENTDPVIVIVNDAAVATGKTVDIPVEVSQNRGLMGYHFTLGYDADQFSLDSVVADPGWGGSFDYNETEPGSVEVIWSNSENVSVDGTVFTLKLKALETASEGYSAVSLSFSESDTYNENWQNMNMDCRNGTVQIRSRLPKIIDQPVNARVLVGQKATFSVIAEGEDLSYQWQASSDGGKTWNNSGASSAKTGTLSVTATTYTVKALYRCAVSNTDGTVFTDSVRIIPTPIITKQPENVTAAAGVRVLFSVIAAGADSYQWQASSDNGKTWKNSGAATAATSNLSLNATVATTKAIYRCVVSNEYGSTYSEIVYITLPDTAPIIRVQPANVTAQTGDKAVFIVVAPGATSYQWQVSSDKGETWKNSGASSAVTARLSVNATAATSKVIYRCIVANKYGTVYSDSAYITLTDAAPIIRIQPVNASADTGEEVSFTVVAPGATSYQWQASSDNGATWKDLTSTASAATANVKLNTTAYTSRVLWRCAVTNDYGTVCSDSVYITRTDAAPIIRTQPVNASAETGEKVSFTVVAPGATSYQWQASSDNGATWKDMTSTSSAATANVKLNTTAYTSRVLWRCAVTNDYGTVCSDSVYITRTDAAPIIRTQPVNASANTGEEVSFTVVAPGATSYRWQASSDNGATWKDLTSTASAATANVKLNTTAYTSRVLWRCAVANRYGTVYSRSVYITRTDAAPVIRTQPVNVSVRTDEMTEFSVIAPGATSYQWQASSDNGKTWKNSGAYNATTANLSVYGTAATSKAIYRCVVSNKYGTAYSASAYITLTDAAPVIRTQPVNTSARTEETVSFTVVATGATSYRWQVSSDDGATWKDLTSTASAATANLSLNTTEYTSRVLWRCAVTNTYGTVYSKSVYITRTDAAPVIRTQPVNARAKIDETVSFTVVAPGATSYRWQVSSDNGATWKDLTSVASAATAKLSLNTTEYTSRVLWRCAVANRYGTVYSKSGYITRTDVIGTQPVNARSKMGEKALFTVVAPGATSYRWQVSSDDGATWKDLTSTASAATANLSLNTTEYTSRVLWRCAVTKTNETVYSDSVRIMLTD